MFRTVIDRLEPAGAMERVTDEIPFNEDINMLNILVLLV